MKLMESGQFLSYLPVTGESPSALDSHGFSYMIYAEVEIDQSFYNPDNPKFPLCLEYSFRYAKKTSRSASIILRHPTSVKPYAKAEAVDVRVDPVTRKPIPFPEWWKTKYGISSEGDRTEHCMSDPVYQCCSQQRGA